MRKNIDEICQDLLSLYQNRTIELSYYSPYTLLIAVLLSAQTTDKSVNRVTTELFKQADTPIQMVALGESQLKALINSIGLFNSKAKNIIQLSQILVDIYDSHVPRDFAQLTSLPGIGRKTANVILNVLYNEPRIAVDTHVFRLANRLGIVKASTPEKTELALLNLIPQEYLAQMHHPMVLHGRYVCTSRKPKCDICILKPHCTYHSTHTANG